MNYPPINDNTEGLWRRIYVIDFPKIFSEDEQDVELTEKLMAELSGIFNWGLEGYNRLRNKGFKFQQAKSMKKAKKNYREDNDSVVKGVKTRPKIISSYHLICDFEQKSKNNFDLSVLVK